MAVEVIKINRVYLTAILNFFEFLRSLITGFYLDLKIQNGESNMDQNAFGNTWSYFICTKKIQNLQSYVIAGA